MKRRQFNTSIALLAGLPMLSGQAAFAALGLAPGAGTADPPMARARFETNLGRKFAGRGIVGDTELRLTSIRSESPGREREQFHVFFDAPMGQQLPEGLYRLQSNGKTDHILHLIPGATTAGRQQMIATINLQTGV